MRPENNPNKTNTTDVLVVGDSGLDRILIKCKNDINSGALFLDAADGPAFREMQVMAGTALLYKLLDQADLRVAMKPNPSKVPIEWITTSKWRFCKSQDTIDREAVEAEFNSGVSGKGGGSKDCGDKSISIYSSKLDEYTGRSKLSDSDTPTRSISNKTFKNAPISPKVISVYSDVHGERQLLGTNGEPQEDLLGKKFAEWLGEIDCSCLQDIVLRAPIEYDNKERRFNELDVLLKLAEVLKVNGEGFSLEKLKKKTTLLINIESLQLAGAPLQHPTCWEETANEAVKCIKLIDGCSNYKAVVVTFSTQGALIFEPSKLDESYTLCFYEGEIGTLASINLNKLPGATFGATTVMHAAITYALAAEKPIVDGVESGIMASSKGTSLGYCLKVRKKHSYLEPVQLLFPMKFTNNVIMDNLGPTKQATNGFNKNHRVELPSRIKLKKAIPDIKPGTVDSLLKAILVSSENSINGEPLHVSGDGYTINAKTSKQFTRDSRLFLLCRDIVKYGRIESVVKEDFQNEFRLAPPYLRLNNLLTFDRGEIRQICFTYNVLKAYSRNKSNYKKPISISVFGSPGSGKSFIVEEITKHMLERGNIGVDVESLVFNVAQMRDYTDLISAFHRVRDMSVKGKMPIVFFDEFDSSYGLSEQGRLGWLRYFLAPMQSGEFLDEHGVVHHIGSAVYVFAGGIFESMGAFKIGSIFDEEERKSILKTAKVHDFISRLKGNIDVKSPNSTFNNGIMHYFRRASLLRTCLERQLKLDKNEEIRITDDVIMAFLKGGDYTHGTRSMEAIIVTSELFPDRGITASDINKGDSLNLYFVDEEAKQDFLKELWHEV